MTKGQLIVKCLKLLNENNGEKIDDKIVSELPEYSDRTTLIIPSINRALYKISDAKKLPGKTYEVTYIDQVNQGNTNKNIKVDSTIVNDMTFITNIVLQDMYGNIYTNVSYFIDGDTCILPPLSSGQKYTIFYKPKVVEISEDAPDISVLDYPDYILNPIPYFVKGELFEEDDPNLAVFSRNVFERLINEIPSKTESVMRGVVDVYGLY